MKRQLQRLVLGNFAASDSILHINQVQRTYSGPLNTDVADSMMKCLPDAPLMIQITKLYHTADASDFRAFGRVMSGTARRGIEVKVLGEGYSPEDEEDMAKAVIEDLWISESRSVPSFYCR